MSTRLNEYVEKNFKIRYCYKYKGVSYELCQCGRKRELHSETPTTPKDWSFKNNTRLRTCDNFGVINFEGYDNLFKNRQSRFIRFNCENEPLISKAVSKLITTYWKFPIPRLIISVNGGYKRMNFKTNQQKKNFKQGLIEVMKKDTTWIIGGGFNVGIHKLISEAVQEYRLHHEETENQVKLIGISTWGVVFNNESLEEQNPVYKNNTDIRNGKVALDGNYDAFLFCDDGTERQYGKETDFRLKFEKCVQEDEEAFAVQILYEGGKRALEDSYNALRELVPLVVIKGSGRAADIIVRILDLPKKISKNEIKSILEEYEDQLKINGEEKNKFENYLNDIYSNFKSQIVIYDILDRNMKLDKKILEAILSRSDDNDLEKLLTLTIRFDCANIADIKVFQDPNFVKLSRDILRRSFKEVLELNRPEFVQLFLNNNFNIEEFINEDVLLDLYKESLSSDSCRCADLIKDLISRDDKSSVGTNLKLDIIYKIIRKLTGNILEKKKYDNQIPKKIVKMENSNQSEEIFEKMEMKTKEIQIQNIVTSRELFLWALLCGYIDMAIIFWTIGKDHIGSALIGSIILKRMKNLILKRGYSDISQNLNNASIKFQEMAIAVVTEAYNNNELKTYTLLIRTLDRWNKMTCLQIALSGNLLDFLNISACRSHTRNAWMGELSKYTPIWKIMLTIPFSLILIRPLIFPSNTDKKSYTYQNGRRSPEIFLDRELEPNFEVETNISYYDSITKFYQAPIVKFIIHLASYIVFLIVFAYLNLVELDKFSNIINIPAEIFVYVYIFGIILEEIRQVADQERTGNIHKLKAYLNGSWNIYDIVVILLSLITITVRFSLSDENMKLKRCFFAVTLSMFCIRSMQFYFISPSIGPKVIMIRNMIVDILFFISIFVLFLISYGTLVQSIRSPNSEWHLPLIKNVFYQPYFQTYGELMLDTIEIPNPCNTSECIAEYSTITIGFAVFLLLTNILLMNLLIAMFGHTFNKIQGDSEKFFAFIQMQLVEEFSEKPLLPPPLNILYYLYVIGNCFCNRRIQIQNSFLVKHLDENDFIKYSGFEHLCMESSMLEMQSRKFDKNPLINDTLFENVANLINNDNSTLSFPMSSNKESSRLDKLEKQLERISKFFPE